MTKVLAISGSLRSDSFNAKLLRNAVALLGDGVEVEILHGLRDVPPYDEDDDRDGAPEPVRSLRAAFAGADAVVVGASTGAFGAVWAQAELRKVLAAIGARVVEAELAVGHASTRFDEDGTLVDEDLCEQLGEVVDALVSALADRQELVRAAA
jgi:chromate reductase